MTCGSHDTLVRRFSVGAAGGCIMKSPPGPGGRRGALTKSRRANMGNNAGGVCNIVEAVGVSKIS